MLEHMATITLQSLVQDQLDKGIKVETPPLRLAISAVPALKPVRTRAPKARTQGADPDFCSVTSG